jgi:hypothetical protein
MGEVLAHAALDLEHLLQGPVEGLGTGVEAELGVDPPGQVEDRL